MNRVQEFLLEFFWKTCPEMVQSEVEPFELLNNKNNNRFTAIVRDYPGEPVPEEALTPPPS